MTPPRKMLIIGIDGMDYGLTCQWLDQLPNLRAMAEQGYFGPCHSVFPPDSIPAWATIYTGLDPSEHGIIDSINYLDAKKIRSEDLNTHYFQGNTFWDAVGQAGYRVCVINPFLAYPAWPVNGTMLTGPVFEGGDISTWPENFSHGEPLPDMGGFVDFPELSELPAFREKTERVTREQADLGLKLYQQEQPDLFFLSIQTLDRVKHFFWRFQDPEDPTYPGRNPYENLILDAYIEIDRIVGAFRNLADADTLLVVLSDHGHQRRCTKVFYLNEYLRRRGFLRTTVRFPLLSRKFWTEKAKIFTLAVLDSLNLQDLAFRIARLLPSKSRKALKKSSYIVDKTTSVAYASEFCSANPHGGITIHRDALSAGVSYKALCNALTEYLQEARDPKTQHRIVRWVKHRNELFSGRQTDQFPDLLFELDEDYGINWSVFGPLTGKNATHKKISGGHRTEGLCVLSHRTAILPQRLEQYYELVAEIFGIPLPRKPRPQEPSEITVS
jgi:predicted AlkP superfamily phosphohydrolase/phosphomutase